MGFSALLILGTHRTICVHDYARNPHLSDIVAKPEFFSCHAMRALNREDHLSNNRSSNNILNRDSQWSLAIDSDVLLVFRDDGSDYGPRRGAKFHRTAYRAIQHDAEVVAETVTDTMRGQEGTRTTGALNDTVHDAFALPSCHFFIAAASDAVIWSLFLLLIYSFNLSILFCHHRWHRTVALSALVRFGPPTHQAECRDSIFPSVR